MDPTSQKLDLARLRYLTPRECRLQVEKTLSGNGKGHNFLLPSTQFIPTQPTFHHSSGLSSGDLGLPVA